MIEFTAEDYKDLCRSGAVRQQIATLEETRKSAVRGFWRYLLGAITLAVAIIVSLTYSGWALAAWVMGLIVLVGGIILAILPLSRAGQQFKHPVLETLAERGGLEYLPDGFDPPVYPDARSTLFGNWLSSQSFNDLFHGTDAAGQRFAFYEACLTRKSGKNTETVFTGQVYAFQRRSKGGGTMVIVPDRGLFNFFKPSKNMDRLKFDGDPAFERRFEVYATHMSEALGLIGDEVRRQLLQLRQQGRVFVYVGPEDILVAAWGKNRFEAGSMFRSLGGEERVRRMFDEVCESLSVMKALKRAFD
ncbi:MAG TPA: DUF3137 domain-containing protein [Allosphingosinicella sp.]|nr:DUF3137 domain-containing protein [Allosphingosinicella sp.]